MHDLKRLAVAADGGVRRVQRVRDCAPMWAASDSGSAAFCRRASFIRFRREIPSTIEHEHRARAPGVSR